MARYVVCEAPVFLISLQHDVVWYHTSPVGNSWQIINVACYRYKALAQQYKGMYPTLEIDIEGELIKLKVILKKEEKQF